MESAVKGIEYAVSFYTKDLEAMSEDQILSCAGGDARKPVDFTYEVALVNNRVTARLTNIDPPTMPQSEGWITAPEELCSKDAIIAFFKDTSDKLLAAAQGVSEEDGHTLVGPEGRQEPKFAMANFAVMHTMYHDAQLNFIQSLNGDSAIHWN
jgi:hypothetical protein